jgi:hypothetical protein
MSSAPTAMPAAPASKATAANEMASHLPAAGGLFISI